MSECTCPSTRESLFAAGATIDYVLNGRGLADDPMRLTRRSDKRTGDWFAVRLEPLDWEPSGGYEWTITKEQIDDFMFIVVAAASNQDERS